MGRSSRLRRAALGGILLALALPVAAQEEKGVAGGADGSAVDEEAAVRAVAEGILEADNERNLAAVLGFYAEDAVLMPPNEVQVRGRAAIAPRYEGLFRDWLPELDGRIEELRVAGSWAYVAGRTRGRFRPIGGGEARIVDDAWVMILSKEATGAWRITRLIWHPRWKPGEQRGDP